MKIFKNFNKNNIDPFDEEWDETKPEEETYDYKKIKSLLHKPLLVDDSEYGQIAMILVHVDKKFKEKKNKIIVDVGKVHATIPLEFTDSNEDNVFILSDNFVQMKLLWHSKQYIKRWKIMRKFFKRTVCANKDK